MTFSMWGYFLTNPASYRPTISSQVSLRPNSGTYLAYLAYTVTSDATFELESIKCPSPNGPWPKLFARRRGARRSHQPLPHESGRSYLHPEPSRLLRDALQPKPSPR